MVSNHLRDLCLRELLETESNYVQALELILNGFAKPLEKWANKIEFNAIFENIYYFHHIHTAFRLALFKATQDCPTILEPPDGSKFFSPQSTTNLTNYHIRSAQNQSTDHPLQTSENNLCINPNQLTLTTCPSSKSLNDHHCHLASSSSLTIKQDVVQRQQEQNQQQQLKISQDSRKMAGNPVSCNDLSAHTSSISNPQSSTTAHQVAMCFLNFRERFLKYDQYCANLSKIFTLLDNLVNGNGLLAMELNRLQKEANEGRFKLRDLMALPLQRILKYHILLAELLRNTCPSSDEYLALRRAHQSMLDIGQYINEVKRDTESMQMIDNIQRSIIALVMPPNTSLIDYGRLIKEGPLKMGELIEDHQHLIPIDSIKCQKKYIFLFDKVMLVCKETGFKNYQFRQALVLSNYSLSENINDFYNNSNPSEAANPTNEIRQPLQKASTSSNNNIIINRKKLLSRYYFQLKNNEHCSTGNNNTEQKSFIFYVKTDELKRKWLDAISKALDNINPRDYRSIDRQDKHDFIMYTFERACSCDHCGKLLLGLFYQGYRCRRCFVSCHRKCMILIKGCGLLMQQANRPHSAIPMQTKNPFEMNSDDQQANKTNLSDEMQDICLGAGGTIVHSKSVPCFGDLATTSSDENSLQKTKAHEYEYCEPDDGRSSSGGHFDFILADYPWFRGRMDREEAQQLLENAPDGSFLVRISAKHNGAYVISLNHQSHVKHMRVYVKQNQLFLSQRRLFKSIIELIDYYEQNSLIECFHTLDAKLSIPYKR